jgi:GNAT superfamily N-acetyltransferase
VIRRADTADGAAVAALFLAVRADAARRGTIPPVTDEDDARRHFIGLVAEAEVWVDTDDRDAVVAMMVLDPGWLEHLYVHPAYTGRGIGSGLVDFAKHRLGNLQLWTFQANAPARAFYARHGFAEVEFTDGSGNMERAPDVRLQWAGSEPGGGVLPRLGPVK